MRSEWHILENYSVISVPISPMELISDIIKGIIKIPRYILRRVCNFVGIY